MLRSLGCCERSARSGVTLAALPAAGTQPAAPDAARSAATSRRRSPEPAIASLGSAQAICDQSGSPHLVDEVETAIDWLVQNRPQLFDKTDVAAPSTDLYKVVDTEGYLDGVAQVLRVIGVCAQRSAGSHLPADPGQDHQRVVGGLRRPDFGRLHPPRQRQLRRPLAAPPRSPSSSRRRPRRRGAAAWRPTRPGHPHRLHRAPAQPRVRHARLDARSLVGPDTAYCSAIGYTDGRSWCPVRMPGIPSGSRARLGGSGTGRTPVGRDRRGRRATARTGRACR
jgi:hypothetical protein